MIIVGKGPKEKDTTPESSNQYNLSGSQFGSVHVAGIFKVHRTGQSHFPMGLPKRIRVIRAGDIVIVLFILIIPLSTYINT